MNEALAQVLSYVPAVWRRRWLIVGCAWLVCFCGWALVSFIPDTYRSSAKVYIDTQSLLAPLLRGIAVDTNPLAEIQMMQRTLKSRPNLEKVARMTDLDLAVKTAEEQERLIAGLQEDISISSDRRGPGLFSISYENKEPPVAQKVVQALLTIFVEGNLGASRKEMDAARQFIDEQLRKYEEQINAAEERIARFKQVNMGYLPGETGFYESLTAARSKLEALRASLQDADTRAQELKRQLTEVPRFLDVGSPQGLGSGPPSNLTVRILELEHSLDSLLLRYTDNHPDVVATRTLLESLREEFAAEEDAFASPDGEQGSAEMATEQLPNELYQQIKLQVVDADAQVATVRTQITRQEEVVAQLEKNASRVPEVEAEMRRLTRDLGVIRNNYSELLSRKEAASLSESRETKGEKVQFRIVDPPNLPHIPTGVKRSLYLTLVLVAGIGAGVGLAGVIVGLQSTFFGAQHLMQTLSFPVLGSVSMIRPPGRTSWRAVNLASFFVVCFALLGTYGGLMSIERKIGLPKAIPEDIKAQVMERLPAPVVEFLAE